MKKIIIGYARETVIKNDTLAVQEKLLKKNKAEYVLFDTFNGKNREKPILEIILKKLNKEDTLIISRLDIIADSTEEAYEIILELHNRGVIINILDMGIIDNTKTGIAILNTIKAFIAFNKNIRTKHLQEGRAKSRRNINYKDGRKTKYSKEQIDNALKMLERNTYDIVVANTGISKSTLARYKKEKLENKNTKLEDYYKKTYKECKKLLEDIGIEIGKISSLTTFSENNDDLGWCQLNKDGTFTIAIREQLFDKEKVAEEQLKDTILHELLHAEKSLKALNHGKYFHALAKKVNEEYGYNVDTHDTTGSWHKEYKLVWLCESCGYAYKRDRKGKARCNNCEGVSGTFFKTEDFEKFEQIYLDDENIYIPLYELNGEIYSVPTIEELEKILSNKLKKKEGYLEGTIRKTKTGFEWNEEVFIVKEDSSEERIILSGWNTFVEMINEYSEEKKNIK